MKSRIATNKIELWRGKVLLNDSLTRDEQKNRCFYNITSSVAKNCLFDTLMRLAYLEMLTAGTILRPDLDDNYFSRPILLYNVFVKKNYIYWLVNRTVIILKRLYNYFEF